MSKPNDLVIVFSSNTFESELAKNELENNGVASFLKDELMGTIAHGILLLAVLVRYRF